jgi:hypothetical protein
MLPREVSVNRMGAGGRDPERGEARETLRRAPAAGCGRPYRAPAHGSSLGRSHRLVYLPSRRRHGRPSQPVDPAQDLGEQGARLFRFTRPSAIPSSLYPPYRAEHPLEWAAEFIKMPLRLGNAGRKKQVNPPGRASWPRSMHNSRNSALSRPYRRPGSRSPTI